MMDVNIIMLKGLQTFHFVQISGLGCWVSRNPNIVRILKSVGNPLVHPCFLILEKFAHPLQKMKFFCREFTIPTTTVTLVFNLYWIKSRTTGRCLYMHFTILFALGSMTGKSIEAAKQTLLLFLKSLPMGSAFNVVSFGSTYEFLFQ